MRTRSILALLTAAALVAACAADDDPDLPAAPPEDAPDEVPDDTEPAPDEDPDDDADAVDEQPDEVTVAVTDVATDLDAPWDVAWLGDRVLLTERDSGRLLELADDGSTREVRTFEVDSTGEGGLLGIAAGPDDLLYVYLTTSSDNRVVRLDPDADAEPEVVLDGIPAAATHNGGRIAFGPDGMLYVATGDAQDQPAAQDPDSLAGKILRVTPGGGVPDDNPTGDEVWSLGHRNVQGLAFDTDGRLFAPEFGPDVDDEINLIEPGANYGWPEVTGEAGVEGFTDPLLVRQPAEASWSGGAVLVDGAIPQWEGDLFVAALRGERLWRVPLADGALDGEPEELYVGEHGRLREVMQAPDGSLWVLTNNRDGRGSPRDGDDRILRIGPASG
ncbi:PQQ-dependent sugar dehydrogenase [Nitriliruptor alkaliphilus]|uniref:PQQ-dependent sugar dehydrogenase n=1 Tax=Nitriliruptor alkaliphilus TaxID=427918 RepID=UPI000696919F|nr:PQQ-dependent sugar dehydrogenase [Nitriliruptor alkaliphilus]